MRAGLPRIFKKRIVGVGVPGDKWKRKEYGRKIRAGFVENKYGSFSLWEKDRGK